MLCLTIITVYHVRKIPLLYLVWTLTIFPLYFSYFFFVSKKKFKHYNFNVYFEIIMFYYLEYFIIENKISSVINKIKKKYYTNLLPVFAAKLTSFHKGILNQTK